MAFCFFVKKLPITIDQYLIEKAQEYRTPTANVIATV